MAPSETLIAFALAMVVFAAFPGPAVFYTAAQTLARGRRAGVMAALGLHVGGYVHVLAAAFGLSAMLTHVPAAYAFLKIAGALYLVWLGICLIRQATVSITTPKVARKSDHKTQRRAFLESITVEILNPKTALFFVAFLPQFVDPAATFPVAVQFFILGVATLVAFAIVDLATVVMAGAVADRAADGGWLRRAFGWGGGVILITLGAKLALESRP